LSRLHSVDADVVGVRKAVESVLLNFRKAEHFITFRAVQQQRPVVDRQSRVILALVRKALQMTSSRTQLTLVSIQIIAE
jgi:hypothetical protein